MYGDGCMASYGFAPGRDHHHPHWQNMVFSSLTVSDAVNQFVMLSCAAVLPWPRLAALHESPQPRWFAAISSTKLLAPHPSMMQASLVLWVFGSSSHGQRHPYHWRAHFTMD